METGRYIPVPTSLTFFIREGQVHYFYLENDQVKADKFSIERLDPGEPFQAVDPKGLAFNPTVTVMDTNEIVYLLSPHFLSIFCWSVAEQRYLATIPLKIAPKTMTYSASSHTLYLMYSSNEITQINLAATTPVEEPFAQLERQPEFIEEVDRFLFVSDKFSSYLYNWDGTIASEFLNFSTTEIAWQASSRRIYMIRFSRLHWLEIDEEGVLLDDNFVPLNLQTQLKAPLSISPDGSRLLTGYGTLIQTDEGTVVGQLSNDLSQARWSGERLFTTRPHMNGTQIQYWAGEDYPLEGTHLLNGDFEEFL